MEALEKLLDLRQTGTEVMIFTGNRGCIQIHSGPIKTLRPMGPWQNVMDPDFNLHLRRDHIAEVIQALRDDQLCRFGCLIDICGVDYPERETGLFEMEGIVSRKKQLMPHLARLLAGYLRDWE